MKFFDDGLEKRILAYCLKSKDSLTRVIQSNPKIYFYRDIHRNLFITAQYMYKSFDALLTEDSLIEYMKSKNVEEAKIDEYKLLVMEVKGMEVDDASLMFYIDQLKSYHSKRLIYEVFDKGLKDMEQLDGPQVLENLQTNLAPLKNLTANIPLIERFIYDTTDDRKESYLFRKEHHEETKGLLFGFDVLDEITNGLYQKEIAMFFGRTGSGKSRVLNNIAFNLSEKGEPGILFSLEMYIDQLERLYDARGAKLSYKKIKKGELTPEEEIQYFEFLVSVANRKPPLYLVDYSGTCSPSFIQGIIRERKKFGPIKWICLDYLTLMSPDAKWLSEPAKYGLLSRELKQIAKAEDIAVITASQSNRESAKSKKVGTQHVSLSDQITHDCDLIVHLRQDEQQELQNILEFSIVKYRDGESKKKFEMFVDWDKNLISNVIKLKKGDDKCQTSTTTPTAPILPPQTPNQEEKFF